MQVNRMIIHNLQKELNEKASLFTSNDPLDTKDRKVISIVSELDSRFRANYHQGIFSIESGDADTFQKVFDNYLSKKKPSIDERFISFTKIAVSFLYQRIDTLSTAKGGYIVFADYTTSQSRHYFSVFLIRDVSGKAFKQNNRKTNIIIEEVIHADTTHLAMACRIDISKYEENPEETYLHFLSIRNLDASQYFLKWIGAERKKRNIENSKILFSIIQRIDTPNDENDKPLERQVFYRQVYDLVKTFTNKEINVNSFSKLLFDDETILMNYAENNNLDLVSDFSPYKNVFNRLIIHSVTGDKISLTYPPDYYKNKVKIDGNNPSLTIINSKSLADAIRAEENEQ